MRDCDRYNRNKIDGKEITVTLEDALISLESLRFMLGGAIKKSSSENTVKVSRTEEVVCGEGGIVPLPKDHITQETLTLPTATTAAPIRLINLTTGARTQLTSDTINGEKAIVFKNDAMGVNAVTVAGDHIRIFWVEEVTTTDAAVEVTISPSTFPGTYRVVGDTFMRSQKTGKDEAFQFVINKAKVSSEVTITLEAEGDPSTFEMTLTVLRATNDDGQEEMMKLVRYGGETASSSTAGDDIGSIDSGN